MNYMTAKMREITRKMINEVEMKIKRLMNDEEELGEYWISSDPDAPIVEHCRRLDPKEAIEREISSYKLQLKILRMGNWFHMDLPLLTSIRRKRKNKPITVVYENSLKDGLFEKVLADIYSRKIRNGTLSL